MTHDPMHLAALDRAVVRLADGRTARLAYWPDRSARRRSPGAKARVILPSGRWLSVDLESVSVAEIDP